MYLMNGKGNGKTGYRIGYYKFFFSNNVFLKRNKILLFLQIALMAKRLRDRVSKQFARDRSISEWNVLIFFPQEVLVDLYGLAVLQQIHNIISDRSVSALYQNSNR